MKGYAVITGASSGIGTEFAKKLSKQGFRLVLVARREERLKQLAKTLSTECIIITADLSKEEECYELVEKLENKRIDLFINNAGFGDCGKFDETSMEKELDMIQVNIKAVHILTKMILKKMKKEDRGYILNVASSAGLLPAGPYMATYYATKSYVTSFTQAIAMELKEENSNVYVGCLCPGPVNTEFNDVANVNFALSGISSEYCVKYALSQMKKRKVVIVPTIIIKTAVMAAKLIPNQLCIKLAGNQQKKKLS